MKNCRSPKPAADALAFLTVVIPARNEVDNIESAVRHVHLELKRHVVAHEIIVVDDGSTDDTWGKLGELQKTITQLNPIRNHGENGFGNAIIQGIDSAQGDAVVIMMADESDDYRDVLQYWTTLNQGWDCVFGSRFMKGGAVIDYPIIKLVLNRLFNWSIKLFFQIPLNDTTNAFKAYRMTALDGCRPFLSPHFNLTVELPLKAIVRGYSWTTIPTVWRNRRYGVAKLKIREMGSRYFFIVAYVWLEKYFSKGDYRKRQIESKPIEPSS